IEKAAAPLKQAEEQAKEGGAEAFADRIQQCRADYDTLEALDRAYDLRFRVLEYDDYDIAGMLAGYREAFRKFGIVFGSTPPEEAARRINQSNIRDRLLMALDQWLAWSLRPFEDRLGSAPLVRVLLFPLNLPRAAEASAQVLPVLKAADRDAYRNELRAAIAFNPGGRTGSVARLLSRPEAANQPGWFAVVASDLGGDLGRDQGIAFLQAAFRRNPGDWRIGIAAADVGGLHPPRSLEVIPLLKASLAVRPNNLAG
ncbi:MAG: hypothetical protein K2X91_04315, partial [Thermoleophilia bacterium]|nr:hypothetical protein [Thermoleophilia bacterium]